MEPAPKATEQVRCVACHTVYEQPVRAPKDAETVACPACGGTAWLAAHIPVEQTTASVLP